MIIKFTNFSDGVHFFDLSKSCAELEIGEPYINDVLLKCKMDKSHHQIYISCDLSVDAELVCDRCTCEFERTIHYHFENLYLFGREAEQSDDIGVYQLSPDSDKIDLSSDTSEYARLAIPMKNLCSEDCKGLCTKCGANLNEETCNCKKEDIPGIWEPLRKLKIN
jgi:uncharacterized protein